MKNYIKLTGLLLFFASGLTTLAMRTKPSPTLGVYVKNMAKGKTGIEYNILIQVVPMSGEVTERFKMPFGSAMHVGQLDQIADIKTSGDYTTWTSNKKQLDQIKEEAMKGWFSDINVYLNVTANPTGYSLKDKDWHWAESGEKQSNPTILTPGFPLILSVEDIQKGALGPTYAQKVKDICTADYSKQKASGFVNLCEHLTRKLQPLFGKISPDIVRFSELQTPSNMHLIKQTEDEIRETIDLLHKKFSEWKQQGKI